MIVYPALDLLGGRCVRLSQGRFDDPTLYPVDPVDAVLGFEADGAEWAHIVDLDGARAGEPRQHGLLADIALSASAIKLQVSGGFRTPAQIERMFNAGADRIVIGSLAATEPELARRLIADFGGDRIALALDVRFVAGVPTVVARGWTEISTLSLWDAAAAYPGARHLLVTDVSRDGMMAGPNLALLRDAAARLPEIELQASGGVAALADLDAIAATGAAGAIVGKALWEGRFTLAQALQYARA